MDRRAGANWHRTAFVHPMAWVAESCALGADTKVWQFASVIRGAQIGEGVTIASGALVDGSRVDDGAIICQNVAMGPGFHIGAGVFVGPNVTICNDAWPRAHKTGFNASGLLRGDISVLVDAMASIGANAVVLPGVRVGAGAMVAAGAVVDRDVPGCHVFRRDGTLREITSEDEARQLRRRIRLVGNG